MEKIQPKLTWRDFAPSLKSSEKFVPTKMKIASRGSIAAKGEGKESSSLFLATG